jgi:hypothetical protein
MVHYHKTTVAWVRKKRPILGGARVEVAIAAGRLRAFNCASYRAADAFCRMRDTLGQIPFMHTNHDFTRRLERDSDAAVFVNPTAWVVDLLENSRCVPDAGIKA